MPMPNLAYVQIKASCPNCRYVLDDMISFQWGYCPALQPLENCVYQIGNSIQWAQNSVGTISPWAYFSDGGANIGDPAFTTLDVTDVGHWTREDCVNCGHPIGGGVVEINLGRITDARLYTMGEYPDHADVFMKNVDGKLVSMTEWYDHSMSFQ